MSIKVTSEDAEIIALAVTRALQQARSVSDSEHYDHHKWIEAQIESEKWRKEFWRQMVMHVSKWGAVAILSSAPVAAYLIVKHWIYG